MKAHTWKIDGVLEWGEPRRRCAKCGMLAHWIGAREACPWMISQRAGDERTTLAADVTRWPGPYKHNAWRTCKRCSARFRQPKRYRALAYCGPVCVREHERERTRVHVAAHYARKREAERNGA